MKEKVKVPSLKGVVKRTRRKLVKHKLSGDKRGTRFYKELLEVFGTK